MPGTGHSEEPGTQFLLLGAHKLAEQCSQTRSGKHHQEAHLVGNQSEGARSQHGVDLCWVPLLLQTRIVLPGKLSRGGDTRDLDGWAGVFQVQKRRNALSGEVRHISFDG